MRDAAHDAAGLHGPAHRRGARRSCRRRRGTTSATSSSSTTGPTPTRCVSLLPAGARAASGSRPLRRRVRRLAVVLGRRRRAGRPVALAVQGVLHRRQRAARRRGGDDLPVHLGRPRLRAGARLDPGLPEEARLDLDHARPSASAGRPTRGCSPARASAGPARRTAARRRHDRDARAAVARTGPRTTTRRSSTSATSRGSPPAATTTRRCTSSCARAAATASSRRSGRATPTLELFGAPHEEHDALAPVRIGRGFRFTFAYTVDDLETVKEIWHDARSPASRSRPTTSSAASASRAKRVHRPLADRRQRARRGRAGGRGARPTSPCAPRTTRSRPGRRSGPPGAREYLHRLADLIDANVERLAAVECVDMAMLLRSLQARVIARGARNFRAYADLAVAYEERDWQSNGTRNRVLRMPTGPAVVITPWNAPFMLSTWKTAPALAAGCTVVLKPAEWSPLSCSLLADLVDEAGLPARRVQRRAGDRRGGRRGARRAPAGAAHLVHGLARDRAAHRRRGGARTSSRSPPSSAARGRSSCSPTPTSTPPRARRPASTTTPARCASPGRACSSRSRCATSSSSASTPRADEHVLGDPRDDATTVSPLIHPDHLARVDGLRRARAGERRRDRARRPAARAGCFYEPTLIEPRVERLRDRPARGVRPGAHVPDVRGRGGGGRARQLDRRTGSRRSSTRARRSAPSASAARSAPARSGSTRSSCAT